MEGERDGGRTVSFLPLHVFNHIFIHHQISPCSLSNIGTERVGLSKGSGRPRRENAQSRGDAIEGGRDGG